MEHNDILKIQNLSVRLDDTQLFRGISLAVNVGEKITIAGPSGSGKSTLLRCVLGFVPFEGEICIGGTPLYARTVWQLRRQLAYVAQEPELGDGTVQELLARPFSYKANQGLAYGREEVGQLFEHFRLPLPLLHKDITTLSGGEKQRVALIGALLLRRPLLLLDEAASALDGEAKKQVRAYLSGREDLAIVSVSHDVRDFVFNGGVYHLPDLATGDS